MKAYPGYDGRPPPDGSMARAAEGVIPRRASLTQLDVREARPHDAGVAAYAPSGGPSKSIPRDDSEEHRNKPFMRRNPRFFTA